VKIFSFTTLAQPHEGELVHAPDRPETSGLPVLPRTQSLTAFDGLLTVLLGMVVGIACFVVAAAKPSYLLHSMDFWFEADTIREVSNMLSRTDDHARTSVHPLFSLLSFGSVYLVKQAFGIPALQAVLFVTGLMGGVWAGTLYLVLRLLGCRRLDATVFTALGLSSASAIFWLSVPNSYTWGSWSIMVALALLLAAEQRRFGATAYVLASALTLSVTVTNWMAGLLTTLARWPVKKAVQLSINAFCLVVLVWGAQKFLFPSAEFFLGSRTEANWFNHPQSGTLQNRAVSFTFHTLVAPAIRLIDDDGYLQVGEDSFRLSQRLGFQFSAPGSAGPLGVIAVCLWSALLLNGLRRLVTLDWHLRFRLVLAALLSFQLALHLVYGEETFTYSLNFLPLLLTLAAMGTLGPSRPLVLVLAAALTVIAGLNNWQQFQQAVASATHFTPQRETMMRMMQKDPARSWPRSVGHIPLALPGAPEAERAYHEPGGDFSPQPQSFGVSLWLCDADGHPIITSQTIPLRDIHQTFAPSSYPSLPAIESRTPYYEAIWSRLDATRWELRFTNRTSHVPMMVIRSVGPAGGPVTALKWNEEQLEINGRWAVKITPAPAAVSLADESAPEGIATHGSSTAWSGESGWGFARLTLPAGPMKENQEYRLIISDSRVPIALRHYYNDPPARAPLMLPDPRFHASMQAQITHLMMGLVDGETRPGDPLVFVRAWQRPGASITTALARAGDPHVARVLSQFIATHDFAGADGPDADAPGWGIWALAESARYVNDPAHDRWLWPHVLRKAQIIETMLTASTPVEAPFVVPSPYEAHHGKQSRTRVVAQPARDGLIVGRVGNDWPSPYVNAVSYQGLMAAAEFATRLGKHKDAERWRTLAQGLQERWQNRRERKPLIPVARSTAPSPAANVLLRVDSLGDPLWMYRPPLADHSTATALTQARQLLRAGRPEEVWRRLEALWSRQASPGLYTWEAPRPVTDVADGWQYARGWHRPGVISPDYETAALLLLLQQDMLAYVDGSPDDPTVVIGAGIPKAWTRHPMAASGVAIPGGSVDWHWDGQWMQVTVHGPSMPVRIGRAFGEAGISLNASHAPAETVYPEAPRS
jgi:hypothetical protein